MLGNLTSLHDCPWLKFHLQFVSSSQFCNFNYILLLFFSSLQRVVETEDEPGETEEESEEEDVPEEDVPDKNVPDAPACLSTESDIEGEEDDTDWTYASMEESAESEYHTDADVEENSTNEVRQV